MEKRIFTVSEVAHDLKTVIEDNFAYAWISGELSNTKLHSSGHFYFTIKDENAQLSGAMWRAQVTKLKFRPEDGMKVIVAGRLSFYPQQGKTQLYAEHLEPDGVGALQMAFEQLKARLETEGLFDETRKRPLPLLPRKVGIITSETGAVIHDLIRNLKRRFPSVDIVFAPAKVQGAGAALDIAEKIDMMNTLPDVDVVIVGRGGGSLEDLWAFNEEAVARAIYHSRIPIISAVGHESDFTIADFVADVRASTPTAAAELAVPLLNDLLYTVDDRRQSLLSALQHKLRLLRERLRYCVARVYSRDLLARRGHPLHELMMRLEFAWRNYKEKSKSRVKLAHEKLTLLSPLAILDRGYAIVVRPHHPKIPIKDAAQLTPGEPLDLQLARGKMRVIVK